MKDYGGDVNPVVHFAPAQLSGAIDVTFAGAEITVSHGIKV